MDDLVGPFSDRMVGGASDQTELVAMIYAYLDGSGDDKRERYSAVGGLIAEPDRWRGLEILWVDAMQGLKEPFRSTDCESQHGQFEGWSKPDCDALMATLVQIIFQFRITGWATVVNVPDHRAVFGQGEDAPYFLGVKHTISSLAQVGSQHGQDVSFLFESSERTDQGVHSIYRAMRNRRTWEHRDRLASIAFTSKRIVGAQAADLIAREAFKHFDNLGVRPTRKPLLKLSERVWLDYWDREPLEKVRDLGPDDLQFFTGDQDPSLPGPFRLRQNVP